jgi:membrane protein implicated in regulation of membrane protease activity
MSHSEGDRLSRGDWVILFGVLLLLASGPMVLAITAGFALPLWFQVLGWATIPASIGLLYLGIRIADREDADGEDRTDRGDGEDDPT